MFKTFIRKYGFVFLGTCVLFIFLLQMFSFTNDNFNLKQIIMGVIALAYGIIIRSIDDILDYPDDLKQQKKPLPYSFSIVMLVMAISLISILTIVLTKTLNIILISLLLLVIFLILVFYIYHIKKGKSFLMIYIMVGLIIIEMLVFNFYLNLMVIFYLIICYGISVLFGLKKGGK